MLNLLRSVTNIFFLAAHCEVVPWQGTGATCAVHIGGSARVESVHSVRTTKTTSRKSTRQSIIIDKTIFVGKPSYVYNNGVIYLYDIEREQVLNAKFAATALVKEDCKTYLRQILHWVMKDTF